MHDDLDLRAVDRHHDADPEFREALRRRVAAILDGTDTSNDDDGGPVPIDLAAQRVDRLERHRRRWVISAAAVIAAAAAVVGVVLVRGDDPPAPADHAPAATDGVAPPTDGAPGSTEAAVPPTRATVAETVPATAPPSTDRSGWIAFDMPRPGGDARGSAIYLVRPGDDPRPLEVGGAGNDDACPTWSPDGTKLVFGRLSSSTDGTVHADLVIVPVDPDGTAGTPTVIALDGFVVLPGFEPHPCAIWAPDGRWVALAGGGEVWVVDTLGTGSGAIRRLPNLRPSDLEWRPGTDELTIVGDVGADRSAPTSSSLITIYSVSTGEVRRLGSLEAAFVTWSPDGSTLAYSGGEEDTDELWLVDADGADRRLLTHLGIAIHGIGPVWSPAGDLIVFQRTPAPANERHNVVLVRVADGSESVIEPPETEGPGGASSWYPYFVTWAPDGRTLLYGAWSQRNSRSASEPSGLIMVATDAPTTVTVLTDDLGVSGDYGHRWAPTQMWGGQAV